MATAISFGPVAKFLTARPSAAVDSKKDDEAILAADPSKLDANGLRRYSQALVRAREAKPSTPPATRSKRPNPALEWVLKYRPEACAAVGLTTSTTKDESGPTPAPMKARPAYQQAHDRGFDMVARDVGFRDGLRAAQALRPKKNDRAQ